MTFDQNSDYQAEQILDSWLILGRNIFRYDLKDIQDQFALLAPMNNTGRFVLLSGLKDILYRKYIQKIEYNMLRTGMPIINQSERFIELYDWVCNNLHTPIIPDNKDENVSFMRDDYILSETQIEFIAEHIFEQSAISDLRRVFGSPFREPSNPLRFKISTTGIVYFFQTLIGEEILIKRGVPALIGKLKCFSTMNGNLLTSGNYNQSKKQMEDFGYDVKEVRGLMQSFKSLD